jgi:hypothetical protein
MLEEAETLVPVATMHVISADAGRAACHSMHQHDNFQCFSGNDCTPWFSSNEVTG